MKEIKISIPDYGKEVYALPGTTLFECISRTGIRMRTPCNGVGTCGKCKIQITKGNLDATTACKNAFSEKEIEEGFRLACQCKISDNITLKIDDSALFETETVALSLDNNEASIFQSEIKISSLPLVVKNYLRLTEGTLENPKSDLTNLKEHIGDIEIPLKVLKRLPNLLRENNFSITAVLSGNRLIDIEAGDTTCLNKGKNFGIALDIGTTTIAASLLDISTKHQIASGGILNPQVKYGEDILSRISFQSESIENSEEIQSCVINACNSLIEELLLKNNISEKNVYSIAIAGNTVMQTLLCGVSSQSLGVIPFTSPFSEAMYFSGSELGFNIHPNAEVIIFPIISAYVGGDISAGILASNLIDCKEETSVLFVDVGTNGEIVLHHKGEFYSTAAAAGPAFEGAGLKHGMRAGSGAIEKVIIENSDIKYNVIGDEEPRGICGSALIDLVAELLHCGIIDETGRILSPDEALEILAKKCPNPEPLKSRLIPSENNTESFDFIIAHKKNDRKSFITLTQKDVRNLQLASGAIRAAINILMKNAGITEEDIDKLYIAGGFGNYIRRKNAKKIGLIPNIKNNNIFFIGNTSLIGAKLAICCREKTKNIMQFNKRVNSIDISLDIEFQMEFANAMIFPMIEEED